MITRASMQIDHLSVMATHETGSISVTRLEIVRTIECEIVETIRYAPSVLKASKTAMGGVLSSLARALVLRVLSASMVVWVLIGTEMIGDSRNGKIVMRKTDLHEDSTTFREIHETRIPIMIMTRITAEMESVEAETSRGSEAIMMVLLLHLGRETAMATDLRTEDGERKTMMNWREAIGMIEVIDDGIGIGIMIARNQSLNGA